MATALITGGTGAIGKALVREFSRDYSVIFAYHKNEEAASLLADECGAVPVRCDLSVPAEVKRLAEYADDCSLLINNAGIAQIKLFGDITDEDWRRMTDTNLSSVFLLTREITRSMIRKHRGCVINISSVWGVYGASCEVHYSAVKAGIIGFTKALAKELGPSGVRVNCIAPGVIESPMNDHLTEEEKQELIEATPLMRLGKPGHIAHAARFFEQNDFTTGQILGVDGGFC
ncbi:MAG: SDR family NAD(P)-dependent oxidoreductase [Ruminiclostridium sp.]|nr:SDR family NAD(P)-dependent oxidoreductase [Ruminiclostridium sp.]